MRAATWRALCAAVSANAAARLDRDSGQEALLSRPWCAWPCGSGRAGEQLVVGVGVDRGGGAGGELPGVGAARGRVGVLAAQDAR